MDILLGLIVGGLLVCGCSQPAQKRDSEEKKEVAKSKIIIKPTSSFNDSIVVDCASAVFYSPDSLQMLNIKSVNEDRIYKTLTHDCFYQMQNARMVIRKFWPKIRIIEVVKARYLLFVKKDKQTIVVDLNTKNDICGLFLFDQKKDPEFVDMPNVDTFLRFYFDE